MKPTAYQAKRLILPGAVLSLLLLASNATAVDPKPIATVNADELTADTQSSITRNTKSGQQISIVWWIPIEFWQVALAQSASLPVDTRNAILNGMQDYMVIAVVVADVSQLGSFSFHERSRIEKTMRVTYKPPKRDERRLTPTRSVGGRVEEMLQGLKPVLANSMGAMGENFQLFVFEDKIKRVDARRVDPYSEGRLTVEIDATEKVTSVFETPLNSLFVPRTCPNGKPAHLSWKFCPWSGAKLDDV